MQRKIVAFRQDQRREWIAVLECGHTQHVRHNPPYQERAWVLTAEGRQSFIGVPLECTKCVLELRHAEPRDFYFVTKVINDWWGGRNMRDMLPKLFFTHFRDTSFIVKQDNEIVGFLNGFFSQTFPDEAYIHFVGVHPDFRKHGVARMLYEKFFDVARAHEKKWVRCVTSPVNKTSIAFHQRMGFEIEPGDEIQDGISVHTNYDGNGETRVLFKKEL